MTVRETRRDRETEAERLGERPGEIDLLGTRIEISKEREKRKDREGKNRMD